MSGEVKRAPLTAPAPAGDELAREVSFRVVGMHCASCARSIESVLRKEDEVYCMYQRLESGQVWADLHTKLEDVGRA